MNQSKMAVPVKKRSYKVALTPLADAMFQLLTFFMLTTSLTPYSILTIGSNPENQAADAVDALGTGAGNDGTALPPDVIIWELEDGIVRSGGTEFDRTQLHDLSEALSTQAGTVHVQLVIGPTARIQDVATAMAALRAHAVEQVEIKRVGADL